MGKNFLLISVLSLFVGSAYAGSMPDVQKYRLPYKSTYSREPLTAENSFKTSPVVTLKPGSFKEAKSILPVPIWKGHDKEIEMYWKAWEIAVGNIRQPLPGSGFISPYIDTAYNGNIFMWDSAFILMFARYGLRFFPFQNTLDNFYAKQHPDGFICREIKSDGADCFERYDPVSTGPNLLPWCEMVYYHQTGDIERLHKIFPVLCGYYRWLQLNRTWRNGTYWSSGWGTGMDNLPRVRSKYNPIYSHGHMIWSDANLQQIFTSELLLEMGFYIERWQEIEDLEDEGKMLKNYVRENLWDDKTGFIYDQYSDGSLNNVKNIGAYWALLSDVTDSLQTEKLISHLKDTAEFKRKFMVPSLSADHPKYKENGRYWQGGIWPGTNYMVVSGLSAKGYSSLAREIALNHYEQVFEVYKKTGTFYEYYSPESPSPGFMARDNFVGWTGLTPIAELIEYVIGIRGDYIKKEIVWNICLTEENGILRYPFGMEETVDLICKERKSVSEEPKITVKSGMDFTLIVNYGTMSKRIQVKRGKHTY